MAKPWYVSDLNNSLAYVERLAEPVLETADLCAVTKELADGVGDIVGEGAVAIGKQAVLKQVLHNCNSVSSYGEAAPPGGCEARWDT